MEINYHRLLNRLDQTKLVVDKDGGNYALVNTLTDAGDNHIEYRIVSNATIKSSKRNRRKNNG